MTSVLNSTSFSASFIMVDSISTNANMAIYQDWILRLHLRLLRKRATKTFTQVGHRVLPQRHAHFGQLGDFDRSSL